MPHGSVVYSPVHNTPKPTFQPQKQPKSPTPKLIQRPVSIHGFSSFENQVQSQSKPLSPLPMIQTNFPQQTAQTPPQPIISYGGGSPRGWSHVNFSASPRSPGGSILSQHQNQFQTLRYQAAPPFEMAPPAQTQQQQQQQPSAPVYVQVLSKKIFKFYKIK